MDLSRKVALVTGVTGTVGGRVAARLAMEGMKVKALMRSDKPLPELAALGVEFVRGDITNGWEVLRAAAGVDLVVHSAAYLGRDAQLSEAANVVGTRNVVAGARAGGAQLLVHISTISVYETEGSELVDEETPLVREHEHPYCVTKAESERLVWAAAAEGLAAVVLRPGCILAATNSRWGDVMVRRVADGVHFWHSDDVLPWVHADNFTEMVMLAIRSPQAVGQAYNALDGNVTAAEWLDQYARWLGRESTGPERQPEQVRFAHKKIRELGYQATFGFAETMNELQRLATQLRGASQ